MAEAPKSPNSPPGTAIFQVPLIQQQQARAEGYREFYANGFTFRATISDFSIVFLSLTSPPGQPGPLMNKEEGTAIMTLPTLKVLSEHLAGSVKAIEDILGPIKVDSRMRPKDEQIKALIAGILTADLKE
jgi:hypothetical protein